MRYEILYNDFTEIRMSESDPRKIKLYRVIAVEEFTLSDGSVIPKYAIGGYVQSEKNLPQNDNSWILNLGKVFGDAVLSDGSVVRDNACVYDRAVVRNTLVSGYAHVCGDADVTNCEVRGKATVRGGIVSNCTIINAAQVYERPKLTNCYLSDGCFVHGAASVSNTKVSDTAELAGDVSVVNCIVSGRYVGRTGHYANSTLHEDDNLSITRGFDGTPDA